MKSLIDKLNKIEWSKVIFRNRHCLAFITILAFVFTYGMIAEAQEGDLDNGTGAYTATSDFRESMGIEAGTTPYVDWHEMEGQYELAGGVVANLLNTPSYLSTSQNTMTGRYNDSSQAGNKFITSVTAGNLSVNFPDTAYYFNAYCWNSASSQQFFYNARVSGEGHFAFVSRTDSGTSQGGYVVSDAPFVVGSTRYMEYFGRIRTVYVDEVNTPNNAGFYVYNIYYPATTSVTNLPIYIASSDGASGYTTFTPTESDFSFDNDNFDFNNLRANDIVVDPNPPAPAPVTDGYEHNMYLNATEKMIQINSTSYNGRLFPDTDRISIAYNSFIAQNQDKYKIKVTYSADLMGTAEAPNALESDYTFDEHFEVVKFIPLGDFSNGTYDVNMGTELSKTPGTIGGVISGATSNGVYRLMSNETDTSDFSSFMGMLGDNFGLGMPMDGEHFYYNYWSGRRSSIPTDFEWEEHTFKVEIRLVYNFNLEEETSVGYYEKTYDVLDWENSQLRNNDLSTNYNPSYDDDGNPIILPSDNGSSLAGGTTTSSGTSVQASGGSALAYVAEGAIQIAIQQQKQGGFQMPQESWNGFGELLLEMRNDLTTLTNDDGVASAMQCVQTVTSGILPEGQGGTPNKLWFLIYGGVAGSIAIALWNKAAHNH